MSQRRLGADKKGKGINDLASNNTLLLFGFGSSELGTVPIN